MTAFRIISALVIIGLLGSFAFDLKRRLSNWNAVGRFLNDQTRNSVRLLWNWKGADKIAVLRGATYFITASFFVLLALTGFMPILFAGSHVTGILLIVHVTVAPLFALALTVLALLWAHRLRYDGGDWRVIQNVLSRRPLQRQPLVRLVLKTGFWFVMFFSLPLMLTVILELFPLSGTEGEEFLIRLHGYSALLLLIAASTNIYLTIAYLKYSSK
jgi:hypothetical protein